MKVLALIILAIPQLLYADVELLDINSGMNNRDITFSPDGSMLLTTIVAPKNLHAVIAISSKTKDGWSPLTVAPFSGEYMDIEPSFSPDGEYVYFASKRPKPGREGVDWDLWRVGYNTGKWGEPQNLGEAVNSAGNEFYPSVTSEGVLYFTATLDDTLGHEDIYRSVPVDGRYTSIKNIGAPVNSKAYEFNAFIAPDESYLIFGSQGREGEPGGGDMFISYRADGTFGNPTLLSQRINTNRLDYCPTVFDEYFYFTSERISSAVASSIAEMQGVYDLPGNGLGDIYRIPFDKIVD